MAVVSAPRTAHSSAADDETPEPISTSLVIDIVPPTDAVTGFAQRPHHAGHVGGPAGHVAGGGVERDRDLAALAIAAHGERRAVVGIERHDRAFGQCDRQRETQVVVGVLADQIDPAGRRISNRVPPPTAPAAVERRFPGATSLMNASIADSEPARNFSLVALRRTDISSTWK